MKRALPLLLLSSSFAMACAASSSEGSSESEINGDADAAGVDGGAAPDAAPSQTDASAPVDACATLPSGPFTPQSLGRVFAGSEDFAFDGKGHIVGKRGNDVVLVDRTSATTLASLPGQTFGLRYAPNGNLIAAIPGAGKVVSVSPSGVVTDLLTGLGGPNGVYVDFDSNIWVTEFNGSKLSKLAPDGTRTVLAAGPETAQAANGVVLDASKNVVYYSEYQKGKVNRIDLGVADAAPVNVATIPGAALDGMVLDACGNVYAVDQGSSRLFRVRVDAAGNAAAPAELIATFPTNVANAQFGAGPGFDPKKLYVTGNPGTVYQLDLGVGGAPVPAPISAPTTTK